MTKKDALFIIVSGAATAFTFHTMSEILYRKDFNEGWMKKMRQVSMELVTGTTALFVGVMTFNFLINQNDKYCEN